MSVIPTSFKMIKVIYLKICIAVLALLMTQTLGADETEEKLKSAYIYNIAKFVTWPSQALQGENDPIKIAILGKDPLGKYLNNLNNKMIKKHPINVIHISNLSECRDCHIIFISYEYKSNMKAIRAELQGSPILTISDIDEFIKMGGLISLDMVDKKLRISINLSEARSRGLDFSSKLLQYSVIVQ